MSTLNFNVAGDPKGDQPQIIADNPPGGTLVASHFEGGAPPNRFVGTVPATVTGGGTLHYDHGKQSFRVIMPPGDGPWEAGLPPCLPDEYHGDSSRVAMIYGPSGRTGLVRLNRNVWMDDGGSFRPTGKPQFGAVGLWHRGQGALIQANFQYIFDTGGNVSRILGKVNWGGGEEIDPRWPDYQQTLEAVLSAAHAAGIRIHFTVTGGGDDPVGQCHVMLPVLQAHREDLLLIEAVNEGNASVADAIQIAQIMRQVGVPVAVGLGDQGLETINRATHQAGVNVGILHEERSTDVTRNIRQGWDFRLLEGAPAVGEPQGVASSVAEENAADGSNVAAARACRVICGAGYFMEHEGHGVFIKDYPYTANTPPGQPHSDRRLALLSSVPNGSAASQAAINAVKHLPDGCENWAKFNNNQPVVVPANNVNKLYGCIDGGRFCEIAIGATGPVFFRADQPCQLKIVNPATADVLFEGHLAQTDGVTVNGISNYVLIGAIG